MGSRRMPLGPLVRTGAHAFSKLILAVGSDMAAVILISKVSSGPGETSMFAQVSCLLTKAEILPARKRRGSMSGYWVGSPCVHHKVTGGR